MKWRCAGCGGVEKYLVTLLPIPFGCTGGKLVSSKESEWVCVMGRGRGGCDAHDTSTIPNTDSVDDLRQVFYLVAAGTFGFTFVADKVTLHRLYRTPTRYDEKLAIWTAEMLPVAAFLHLAFGIWKYSSVMAIIPVSKDITTFVASAIAEGCLSRSKIDPNVCDWSCAEDRDVDCAYAVNGSLVVNHTLCEQEGLGRCMGNDPAILDFNFVARLFTWSTFPIFIVVCLLGLHYVLKVILLNPLVRPLLKRCCKNCLSRNLMKTVDIFGVDDDDDDGVDYTRALGLTQQSPTKPRAARNCAAPNGAEDDFPTAHTHWNGLPIYDITKISRYRDAFADLQMSRSTLEDGQQVLVGDSGNIWLSPEALAALQALAQDTGGTNIALGKPVRASSNFDPKRPPSNSTDGKTDARDWRSSAHTGANRQPWIEVDLGAQMHVWQVRVFNRHDHRGRLYNSYILLSERAMPEGEATFERARAEAVDSFKIVKDGAPGTAPHDYIVTWDCDAVGRYVRVQSSVDLPNPNVKSPAPGNCLALQQIQVFGSPALPVDKPLSNQVPLRKAEPVQDLARATPRGPKTADTRTNPSQQEEVGKEEDGSVETPSKVLNFKDIAHQLPQDNNVAAEKPMPASLNAGEFAAGAQEESKDHDTSAITLKTEVTADDAETTLQTQNTSVLESWLARSQELDRSKLAPQAAAEEVELGSSHSWDEEGAETLHTAKDTTLQTTSVSDVYDV
jgi:hypothetical protein